MFDVINYMAFQVHGGGHHHGGGTSNGLESFLLFIEKLFTMTPAEAFAALLPGIHALDNFHPLFVHFPIALFTAFLMIELLAGIAKKEQWSHVASWFLYLGVISTVFTVTAGSMVYDTVEHGGNVHDIMERHKQLGMAVLSLSIALSAWRLKSSGVIKSGLKWLYLFLSVVLFLLVFFTADLGGLMVYKYAVAVEPVPFFDLGNLMDGHGHSHSHTH